MKSPIACLAAIFLSQLVFAGVAQADELPEIVAVLDLTTTDSNATDAFYAALSKAGRKPFYLKLTLKPNQESDEAGYSLSRDPLSPKGSPDTSEGAHVCGNGEWGTIDNFRSAYRLGFKPFEDNHSGVDMTIGDRIRYPFHNMICTTEGYTSVQRTPLLVEGHFVVSIATIPTANIYTLFPYDP